MPWTVDWRVVVDGRDVSANMRPFLIDIAITDKDGTASDSCSLTFDDTDGQTLLPKEGARVQVFLQGALKFAGTVDSVRSSGSRGGGRTLQIGARGFDSAGKVKEPQGFHKDDASLEDFLGQAARNAGLSGIRIGGDLGSITRDYWSADGESFLQLGQRLAREFNATFKIRGGDSADVAILQPRDQTPLAIVTGIVGVNVISWDIEPFTSRKVFTKGKVRYFDRKEAKHKTEELDFDFDTSREEVTQIVRATAADQSQAKGMAKARKVEAEREGGGGSVEMDLAVEAQAEAPFMLSGARPGVDGTWRIVSVSHKASRYGGSTTSLELKQPQGSAGKDGRKAG
ncbi:MAG: hypothetical protein KJZ59_00020 [Pararhodobacter sp.]|nr:hypothetical protein [Pararhodobacter sp.]